MNILKAILGWFLRHALVYLMLVVALIVGPIGWQKWLEPARLRSEIFELRNIKEEAIKLRATSQSTLAQRQAQLRKLSNDASNVALRTLQNRRKAVVAEKEEIERRLSSAPSIFDRLSPSEILARKELEIRHSFVSAELNSIDRALYVRGSGLQADELLRRAKASPPLNETAVRSLEAACQTRANALSAFEHRWWIDRTVRDWVRDEHEHLVEAKNSSCELAKDQRLRREAWRRLVLARDELLRAREKIKQIPELRVADVTAEIDDQIARRITIVEGSFRAAIEQKVEAWHLEEVAKKAAMALLLIIATPFLIRLLFFLVFAPLAERRGAIRIFAPGTKNAPISSTSPSRVSIPVTLNKNEELLVRQNYLQTSPLQGRFATKWFLDVRHPLSSLASGMLFLTRIRGDQETTTVSAIHDPFAELTEIVLPAGSALVLHPRSLVAVVQPIGCNMRVTRHWRLTSLNAWLTMQLRYLAFHGPVRLIVMGGRGIRVEQAERGRVFGQDQLVGFSADLAYSVTRTETFWPYFFGREQLLKDKVQEGSGVLVIEEAPMSRRKGKGIKHGLEGAFDAALKVFGI